MTITSTDSLTFSPSHGGDPQGKTISTEINILINTYYIPSSPESNTRPPVLRHFHVARKEKEKDIKSGYKAVN